MGVAYTGSATSHMRNHDQCHLSSLILLVPFTAPNASSLDLGYPFWEDSIRKETKSWCNVLLVSFSAEVDRVDQI